MGRHRNFDPDTALAAALGVFWAKGFEGASLSELTEAMGINRPSLYATYGDKEALFHKALALYDSHYLGFFEDALAEKEVSVTIRRILDCAVALNSADDHPRGSPDTVGALVCSTASESVRDWLLARRAKREALLSKRFAAAVATGEWPPDTDAIGLASYFAVLLRGMDVQAASGATRAELERVVSIGTQVFPIALRLAA